MVECWKRGLIWRGLVHDMSKFLPSEWITYAEYFYGNLRSTEFFDLQARYGCAELAPWGESIEDLFSLSWLRHQHRNPHHWQYWILRNDDGRCTRFRCQRSTAWKCSAIGSARARHRASQTREHGI
jgi:hypothetical protein